MPWSVKKDPRCGSGYAVVKDSDNELVACHKSRKSAVAQQRALYASETKKAEMPEDMSSEQSEEWDGLTERQQELAESYFENVLEYGMFDQSSKANGAHYAPASANPFKATGLICYNCIFFAEGANQCMIVTGEIEPEAICKLWIIPEENITESTTKSNDIWAGRFIKLNK